MFERRIFRIEIDQAPVGLREIVDATHPHVERDGAEVHEIDERLDVVAHEVGDVALGVLTPDRNRLDPVGHETGCVFLIERLAVDAVGIARQHDGPVRDIGQQPRSHRAVVLDEIALGVLLLRPKDLVEVRELDLTREHGARSREHCSFLAFCSLLRAPCSRDSHVLRLLIIPKPQKHRLPQEPVLGHLLVPHIAHEPKLVCDVRYKEMTKDGLLRQSVFVRFRDDKQPEDVVMPGNEKRETGNDREPKEARTFPVSRAPVREVKFSNLDKIFWPEEKYTKGDLIEYYRSMAPWLLPYLKNRPVVLTRYPDGITGKSFYQKDAPGFVPDWIQTIPIWSEDTQRDIQYFVANDVESLVYLVNLGTIPLHIWMSRIDDLTRPDWCLIDLDPKEAPFEHVVTLAKTMRTVCEEVEMPAFIKTTGKSGLHIMLPLGKQMTYDQCLKFAMLFARLVTDRHPDIATTQLTISKRDGKVYVDAFQNRAGQLMVAPYGVRPSPGAPVSMPIEWNEVNAKLHNSNFT